MKQPKDVRVGDKFLYQGYETVYFIKFDKGYRHHQFASDISRDHWLSFDELQPHPSIIECQGVRQSGDLDEVIKSHDFRKMFCGWHLYHPKWQISDGQSAKVGCKIKWSMCLGYGIEVGHEVVIIWDKTYDVKFIVDKIKYHDNPSDCFDAEMTMTECNEILKE